MSSEGNVKVAVRVRPLCARERLAGATEVLTVGSDGCSIIAAPDKCFTFDSVYPTSSNQQDLFEELSRPMIDCFMEGFNATVLAYGQTGSGKTYTMGTGLDGNIDPLTQGLIPRAVEYIFQQLDKTYNQGGDFSVAGEGAFYEVYVSFLELYNEEINDLLSAQFSSRVNDKSKRPLLTIREDPNGGICITGIKEEKMKSVDDVFECLQKGTLCRTTKSTDMNLVSSRSHAIFSLMLRQRRLVEDYSTGSKTFKTFISKLHFVDLAGSERLKRTGAVGDRAKESISINSGLLALGNVISALGDETKKATHIPYRDSKLTRLLQDSLGGNSRTLMIACVSPSSDNYNETVNTLKYANRARNIKNRAAINEDSAGNAQFEIMQLKKQISSLKQEILQLRGLGLRRTAAENSATPKKPTSAGHEDELNRLRAQNREMKKKLDTVTREKITAESERDFYRNASSGEAPTPALMKTITDLRCRIAELESSRRSVDVTSATRLDVARKRPGLSGGPSRGRLTSASSTIDVSEAPSTPNWFCRADAVIEKTRQELQDNLQVISDIRNTIMDSINDEEDLPFKPSREAFAAAVASKTEAVLNQIQNDMSFKEELIVQLESSKQEYLGMRQRYEDRIKLLHENITVIQRQRDEAIRPAAPKDEPIRGLRLKYEERIKKLGKEINDLREKLAEGNRETNSKTSANEILIKNLRNSLQTTKSEKARLQSRLDELSAKMKENYGGQENELKELRIRERRSSEQAKKYKKAYDFQKSLLQKRIEQHLQTKSRNRALLNILKKNRVPLSPSLLNMVDSPAAARYTSSLIHATEGGPPETPLNYNRSGLASKSFSASDLATLDQQDHIDDENDLSSYEDVNDDPGTDGPTDENQPFPESDVNEMELPKTPSKSGSSPRRLSIIHPTHTMLPMSSGMTGTILRLSPLIPRRKDMFAKLADAASLSIAANHIKHLNEAWSTSMDSFVAPSIPSERSDVTHRSDVDPVPHETKSTTTIPPTSPMKIDTE